MWLRIPIKESYISFIDLFEFGLFVELELKPEMIIREI